MQSKNSSKAKGGGGAVIFQIITYLPTYFLIPPA